MTNGSELTGILSRFTSGPLSSLLFSFFIAFGFIPFYLISFTKYFNSKIRSFDERIILSIVGGTVLSLFMLLLYFAINSLWNNKFGIYIFLLFGLYSVVLSMWYYHREAQGVLK